MHFRKVPPKIISYRDFYLQHTLSQESRDWSKNPDKFYEICHTIFNTHEPKKKCIYVGITTLLRLKHIQMLPCKEHVLETNF